MGVPAIRGFEKAFSSQDVSVALPPGRVNGDQLVLLAGVGTGALATPAGWTRQGFLAQAVYPGMYCFTRVVDGGEGSSVLLDGDGGAFRYGICAAFTGHNPSDPFHGSVVFISGTGPAQKALPQVTTTVPDTTVFGLLCVRANEQVVAEDFDGVFLDVNSQQFLSSGASRNSSNPPRTYSTDHVGVNATNAWRGMRVALKGPTPPTIFSPAGIQVPINLGAYKGLVAFTAEGILVPVTMGDFSSGFNPEGLQIPVQMGCFVGYSGDPPTIFTPEGINIPIQLGEPVGKAVFSPDGILVPVQMGEFNPPPLEVAYGGAIDLQHPVYYLDLETGVVYLSLTDPSHTID